MHVTLVLAAAAVALPLARAATAVEGLIGTNTTWTLDGSPYVVTADTLLYQSATLTIEPGVVVDFGHRAVRIILRGALHARGTAALPVTFANGARLEVDTTPFLKSYAGEWVPQPLDVPGATPALTAYAGNETYVGGTLLEYVHIEGGVYFEDNKGFYMKHVTVDRVERNTTEASLYNAYMEDVTVRESLVANNTKYVVMRGVEIQGNLEAHWEQSFLSMEQVAIRGDWTVSGTALQYARAIIEDAELMDVTVNGTWSVVAEATVSQSSRRSLAEVRSINATRFVVGGETRIESDYQAWLKESRITDSSFAGPSELTAYSESAFQNIRLAQVEFEDFELSAAQSSCVYEAVVLAGGQMGDLSLTAGEALFKDVEFSGVQVGEVAVHGSRSDRDTSFEAVQFRDVQAGNIEVHGVGDTSFETVEFSNVLTGYIEVQSSHGNVLFETVDFADVRTGSIDVVGGGAHAKFRGTRFSRVFVDGGIDLHSNTGHVSAWFEEVVFDHVDVANGIQVDTSRYYASSSSGYYTTWYVRSYIYFRNVDLSHVRLDGRGLQVHSESRPREYCSAPRCYNRAEAHADFHNVRISDADIAGLTISSSVSDPFYRYSGDAQSDVYDLELNNVVVHGVQVSSFSNQSGYSQGSYWDPATSTFRRIDFSNVDVIGDIEIESDFPWESSSSGSTPLTSSSQVSFANVSVSGDYAARSASRANCAELTFAAVAINGSLVCHGAFESTTSSLRWTDTVIAGSLTLSDTDGTPPRDTARLYNSDLSRVSIGGSITVHTAHIGGLLTLDFYRNTLTEVRVGGSLFVSGWLPPPYTTITYRSDHVVMRNVTFGGNIALHNGTSDATLDKVLASTIGCLPDAPATEPGAADVGLRPCPFIESSVTDCEFSTARLLLDRTRFEHNSAGWVSLDTTGGPALTSARYNNFGVIEAWHGRAEADQGNVTLNNIAPYSASFGIDDDDVHVTAFGEDDFSILAPGNYWGPAMSTAIESTSYELFADIPQAHDFIDDFFLPRLDYRGARSQPVEGTGPLAYADIPIIGPVVHTPPVPPSPTNTSDPTGGTPEDEDCFCLERRVMSTTLATLVSVLPTEDTTTALRVRIDVDPPVPAIAAVSCGWWADGALSGTGAGAVASSSPFSSQSGQHVECDVPATLDTATGGEFNVTVQVQPSCMTPAASAASPACHTHGLEADGAAWAPGEYAEVVLPGCACELGSAPVITGATLSSNVTGISVALYASFGPLAADTVGECGFGVVNGTSAPVAAGSSAAEFLSDSKAVCALPAAIDGGVALAVTLAAWRSCGAPPTDACLSAGGGATLASWPALGYGLLTTPPCSCSAETRPSVSFAEPTADRVRLVGAFEVFPDTELWCVLRDKDATDGAVHHVSGDVGWRGVLVVVECEYPAALDGALEIEARIGASRGCSADNTTLCISDTSVVFETPACECSQGSRPVVSGASVLGELVHLAGAFNVTAQTDAWCRFFMSGTLRAVERAVVVDDSVVSCAVPALEPGSTVQVQAWVHAECASFPSADECLSSSMVSLTLPSCECDAARAPVIQNVTVDATGTVMAVSGVFDVHRDSVAECQVSGPDVDAIIVPGVAVSTSLIECAYPAEAAAIAGTLQVDVRVARGCAYAPGASSCYSAESGQYTEYCAGLGAATCDACFSSDADGRCGWCGATETCVPAADGRPPARHSCAQPQAPWHVFDCPAVVASGCSAASQTQRVFSTNGTVVLGVRML